MNYQLIVFRFTYTDDNVCIWPVYFELNQTNHFGERNKKELDKIISELESNPGVGKVGVIHNKIADIIECDEALNSILNPNSLDEGVRIKYLNIENQKISDTSKFDYATGTYYRPIKVSKTTFPVRVRANNFKFLLDELELPVVLINDFK
jgi:hypothetical protein